jgi:transposase
MERDKKVDKLHNMSDKEIKRVQSMTHIEQRQLTQAMAAAQLGISVRQVKRLWRAYREQGAAGLVNKSRGKASHNQLSEEVKQQALDLILERYRDFGPTLATEKLVE